MVDVNLNELIATHKSGRSYEELAKACGGVLTSQRLQQIATTTPKAFPNAATIRGLARGLRVPESVVVLSIAESLGLDVARAVPRLVELLPASANEISERQAAAIAEVIRAFTEERAGEEHDQRSAPIGEGSSASNVDILAVVHEEEDVNVDAPLAAKRGQSAGRAARQAQDQAGEAPDPDGPESGA